MVSLRTKYAGELAVLCTWVSALLPWSVSVATRSGIDVYVVRWQFFLVQFVFGAEIPGERPFQTVPTAVAFQQGQVATAYTVWAVGAVLFAAALLFSIAYYARETRVTAAIPVHPARALGGLLLATGLVEGTATVLLSQSFLGGAVPVGTLFLLLFGVVLLLVERVDATD